MNPRFPTRAGSAPLEGGGALIAFILEGLGEIQGGSLTEIGPSGDATTVSYNELARRAAAVCRHLSVTLAPKATVVAACESVHDIVVALWACAAGGISILPVHCHPASLPASGVTAKLRRAAALPGGPVLLYRGRTSERLDQNGGHEFDARIDLDSIDIGGIGEDAAFDALMAAACQAPGGGNLLLWTSGTAAEPRIVTIPYAVQLRRAQVLGKIRQGLRSAQIFPFDSISSSAVFYPSQRDSVYVQPALLARSPAAIVGVVERFRLENISLASSMAARILRDLPEAAADLSSLKKVGFGAEPIVPDVVADLVEAFSRYGAANLEVSFGYGMTETGLICLRTLNGLDVRALTGETAPALGGPVFGTEIRIVDDSGRAVADGVPGGIEVRCVDRCFTGYAGEDDASQTLSADGWLSTGDRGLLEDGMLRITGRDKDTLIVNGRNISPAAVESALRGTKGIDPALIAAAAVRPAGAVTDELAVFIVPELSEPDAIDRLCLETAHAIVQTTGIAARHIVPLKDSQFPLTASGKIARGELARRYMDGEWPARKPLLTTMAAASQAQDELEAELARLWQTILELSDLPGRDSDFIDLGGDSLATAEMLFNVEDRFGTVITAEHFHVDPTLAGLASMIRRQAGAENDAPDNYPIDGKHLVQRMSSLVSAWPGVRSPVGSLVTGVNLRGRHTPLFWVFQHHSEMEALSECLGPQQPLYAMRSCVNLVRVRDYGAETTGPLVDAYANEIMTLRSEGPIVLGGNCQGAIIALAVARRLAASNRPVRRLVLMEWNFDSEPYHGQTLFLYGECSHTAANFSGTRLAPGDMARNFPDHHAEPVRGGHGRFFDARNVGSLADALLRETSDMPEWLLKRGRRIRDVFMKFQTR